MGYVVQSEETLVKLLSSDVFAKQVRVTLGIDEEGRYASGTHPDLFSPSRLLSNLGLHLDLQWCSQATYSLLCHGAPTPALACRW